MPVAAIRFVREQKYDLRAALGLTLGGIPAVLIAAFVVRSLPLLWLRWLVVIVASYTAVLMLLSSRRVTQRRVMRKGKGISTEGTERTETR